MKDRTWHTCPTWIVTLIVMLAWGDAPALADPQAAPPAAAPAPAPPAPPAAGPASDTPGTPAVSPDGPEAAPVDANAKPAEPKTVKVVMADFAYIQRGISPDLTVTTGVRLVHGSGDQTRWWFARARAGVMAYNEPSFLILGLTGQFNPLDSASLGVELEYLNLWHGFWGLGGVQLYDSAGGTTFEGAFGVTLFGLEYQRRLSGDRKDDQALMLTVHVPLGVVRVARKQDLRPVTLPSQ